MKLVAGFGKDPPKGVLPALVNLILERVAGLESSMILQGWKIARRMEGEWNARRAFLLII